MYVYFPLKYLFFYVSIDACISLRFLCCRSDLLICCVSSYYCYLRSRMLYKWPRMRP